MRNGEVWLTGIIFGVLSLLYLFGAEIALGLPIAAGIFFLLSFIFSFVIVNYYVYQFFGVSRWINPILKLSILLIKLDGVEKISETKRIISYLENELDPLVAKVKLLYYKKQLKKNQDLIDSCERIRLKSDTKEKVRVLQHLIKVALSDRLLTDEERKFIESVAKQLRIPRQTLKAILALHNYVTQEDIKNQRYVRPNSSSFKVSKAYQVLGLEEGANLAEVKEAHRELVKIYHPDKLLKSVKNKEFAKQQFQAITDAYETLKKKLG